MLTLTAMYRKRMAILVLQLARDDPQWVRHLVTRLKEAGEVAPDDLVQLDRMADDWIRSSAQRLEQQQRRRR